MRLSARAGIGARAVVAMAAAAALAAAALVGAPSANATVRWGSAKAPIHPGVKVTIAGVSCLAGLVMTDGTRVFIAVPTSCTGVNDGQPTDGCTAAQVPVGVKATIQGARYRGTLVYSSYTQMQLRGTTGQNMCAHNDLSLIRLDNRDIGRTNPSVPVVGGPTSVAWTAPAQGAQLTAYIVMPTNAVLMQIGRAHV